MILIAVIEAESATSWDVRGGRLLEIPFEADSAVLAAVHGLSLVVAEDAAHRAAQQATEPDLSARQAG